MKNPTFEFIKYTPAYKAPTLALLSFMWPDIDVVERQLKFEWRYEKNPYKEPYIYLAMDGQKVIAFRAFISQIFIFKEDKYTVFSPSDTIVHPEYRRMGIMATLNEIAIDKINKENESKHAILLNTTTSHKSMPVYIKEHWQGTNVLKHFYYKIYPLQFLFNNISEVNGQIEEVAADFFHKNGYKIIITKKIAGEELSEFNAKNRNSQLLSNIRDEVYYNWRYSYQPEKYTLILCKKNHKIVAYAIIKYLSNGKYSLEEYAASDKKAFKNLLKAAYKTMKFSVLRGWALAKEDKELLRKCGFFPEPARLFDRMGKRRFPILVRPIVPLPLDKDFFLQNADIRNIESWYLQIADRH